MILVCVSVYVYMYVWYVGGTSSSIGVSVSYALAPSLSGFGRSVSGCAGCSCQYGAGSPGQNSLTNCPVLGDGVNLLTLYGSNFIAGAGGTGAVTSNICQSFPAPTVTSSTITCYMKSASAMGVSAGGSVSVSVSAMGGASNGLSLSYAAGPPTITLLTHTGSAGQTLCSSSGSLALLNCPISGGGTISIQGSNFGANAADPCTSSAAATLCAAGTLTHVSDGVLTCTLKANSAATVVNSIGVTCQGMCVTDEWTAA